MVVHLAALAWAIDDGSCGSWMGWDQLGSMERVGLHEISGLAASHAWPGTLWMLEDAGGSGVVYAVGTDGTDQGSVSVLGASNDDWEDLALGPCPSTDDCSCLYIGDVGDNDGDRDAAVVWRITEPDLVDGRVSGQSAPAEALWFRYPDGAQDAESIAVDPLTGALYVLTKSSTTTQVYRFPEAPAVGGTESSPVTLEHVASLALADVDAEDLKLTGADISPLGLRWALRTDEDLLIFEVPEGGDLLDALQDDPASLPVPTSPDGEAVAWDPEGETLYLVSEGSSEVVGVTCASFDGEGDVVLDSLVHCDLAEEPVEEGCGSCSTGSGGAFIPWLIPIVTMRRRKLKPV